MSKSLVDKSTGEVVSQFALPFLRTPYNYDRDWVSSESGLRCEDVSLTVQAAKEECDINTIVERFNLTGQLPSDVRVPTYGDFTGVVNDYQTALNAVISADDSFMAMPANVRSRFHNSAAEFVDFCSDPANLDEMRKLGLAVPKDVSQDEVVLAKPAGSVQASS